MTFCPQCSCFKQWFLIPNTFLINIVSCFDIINCIYDNCVFNPKRIIKKFLILFTYPFFERLKVTFRIKLSSNLTSSLTFIFSYMLFSKQKLSIKITYLNIVIISNCAFTILLSGKSHLCK